MGEVYLARDTTLDREVAIKVLPAEMAADEERFERFRREALSVAEGPPMPTPQPSSPRYVRNDLSELREGIDSGRCW